MEDLLALLKRPYDARHSVVCFDEKPVARHTDVRPPRPPRLPRSPGETRQRVYALWDGQSVRHRRTEGGAGSHARDLGPLRRQFAQAIQSVVASKPAAQITIWSWIISTRTPSAH